MLYTYTNTSQTLAINSSIAFNNNGIRTGCTVTHSSGSTTINLNKPGIYMVDFNADGSASVTAGNIVTQLYANGTLIEGAEASQYSGVTGQAENLGFKTLIRVVPNCCVNTNNVPVELTVRNTGVATTYTNVAMTVTKVA